MFLKPGLINTNKTIWWPQGGPDGGPFPIVLPLAGTLELKAA